jgi:hypothetical protein
VAEEIRVAVEDASDGADLVRALVARGLPAALRREGGRIEVVLASSCERTSALVLELLRVLDGWLDDRGRDEVTVRVGTRSHPVRSMAARPGRRAA